MKKFIIILTMAMFAMCCHAQRGEKTIGISAGYNTYNKSAVTGIFFQYRFSKYVRLAPDLQYQIKNNGISGYQFNGNLHVPIAMDSRLNFYPLAGVTYQSWRVNADEDSSRKNYFGANVGGGFEYYATPTMRLAIEGKYSILKKFSNGGFTLSIGYLF